MSECWYMIVTFAFLIFPFAIAGLWWWFWCMMSIAILIIGVELISYKKSKLTISQRFWKWSVNHRMETIVILLSLAIGFSMLIVHLSWELLC